MVELPKKAFIDRLISGIEKYAVYLGVFTVLVLTSTILAGIVYALVNHVPPMVVIGKELIVIIPVTSK